MVSTHVWSKRCCVLDNSKAFLPGAWKYYSLLLCFISFDSTRFLFLTYYKAETLSASLYYLRGCGAQYLLKCFRDNTKAYYKHTSSYWRVLFWWFWNGRQLYSENAFFFQEMQAMGELFCCHIMVPWYWSLAMNWKLISCMKYLDRVLTNSPTGKDFFQLSKYIFDIGLWKEAPAQQTRTCWLQSEFWMKAK